MNKEKRLEILTRLRDNDPHPTTELVYTTPFELLISVLLSAQATDVSVNKATAKLYPVANTPAAMLALGVDGVKEYIKTIGLFNSKAENVIKTCRILLEKHDGEVPEDRAALEARDYVVPDDVKALAAPVLRHRLLLSPAAEIEGKQVEALVAELVESTEAPR